MWVLNSLFNKVFDLLFWPFRTLSPWAGMIFVSLLTGLLMLFIFRLTSNQAGIRKVKDKIKAHLLEFRLFKDNPGVTLKAQGQIFKHNLRYVAYNAKPMLVMIIPILLILIQLNLWFGYESLKPGETAILKIKLKENANPLETDIQLEPPSGIVVETPPLRLEEEKEINWRIGAREKGIHQLAFRVEGANFLKTVAIAQGPLAKISALKVGRNLLDQILNPGEKPLASELPVKTVEIAYPAKRMNLFGWRVHWLLAFFALSIVFGFALKRPFKVEI